MSLLHEENAELDDAARGEELTKGTSHVVISAVIATIVVTLAIAAYMIAGRTRPVADGEILSITAHPMHIETSGMDANGAPIPKETFDQVYVFTHVRLKNVSKAPLFLTSILTNATLPDGIHSSYAASATDYDRIFLAYPDIPVPHDKALPLDTTLEAGQTIEGTIVSAFHLSRQDWEGRKNLDLTFTFRYQPSLKLAPHLAVIDH